MNRGLLQMRQMLTVYCNKRTFGCMHCQEVFLGRHLSPQEMIRHPSTLVCSAPFLCQKMTLNSKCSLQLHRGHQDNLCEVVDCCKSIAFLEWLKADGIKGIKGLTPLSSGLAVYHFQLVEKPTNADFFLTSVANLH